MVVPHFLKWVGTARVSERAAAASALARAYVNRDLPFEDRCAAEAALTLLLDDASSKVRAAMAEALSMSHHAPVQIIAALASDQPEVASLVLARSPLLTDAWGTTDLVQPANARIYYYASSHHLLGLASVPGAGAGALYATNANAGVVPVVRALYQNLEDWVVKGTTPPDNQVPKIADGTLVRPARVGFPAIPGVSYTGLVNGYSLLDWGPNYRPQDESGIATQVPPAYLGRDYAILVPQVDADGNDIAGIRSLDVAVPVGTNTGWNTTNQPGRIDQAGLFGAYFPFVKTTAVRAGTTDPRLSLQERYTDQAGYVAAVTAAANDLVAKRFMLRVDADAAIANATANPVLP